MTSGLPDYGLGIRPQYGSANTFAGSGAMTPSVVNTLLTVSGKGMIYGGNIYLDHTSTQRDSSVRLVIDDGTLSGYSFTILNKYDFVAPRCFPISLMHYDDTTFVYSVGFAYGITFERSLKILYNEAHGSNPTVTAKIIFSLL